MGHKREAIAPCSSHTVSVPEDEQIMVENCHPGIVTKEEFLEVQKRFRKQYPKKDERCYSKERPLVGKAICGTCGRSMNFRHMSRRAWNTAIFCVLTQSIRKPAGAARNTAGE